MGERDERPADGAVYFEFTVIGHYVKTTAIDAATGIEVSIVGATGTAQKDLERLALRKLERALLAVEDPPKGPDRGFTV